MTMENNSASVHILMVPWTGFGHITPMIQLAEALESRSAGFHITITYSARVYAKMKQAESGAASVSEKLKMDVRVLEDGINPDPLYNPTMPEYLASILVMQASLENLVGESMAGIAPITCMVSGTFCPWTQPVAEKFNIPRVEIWSSPVSIYSIGFYHDNLAAEGLIPFKGNKEETLITCIPGLPPIKASDFPREFLPSQSELQTEEDKARFNRMMNVIKRSYGNARGQYRILVNSIYDLEPSAFDALVADDVKACAIGPLFLYSLVDKETGKILKQPRINVYKEDESCLRWLDGKPNASVLYIAFGSESRMTKDEIQELAYGLEECGENFLWVIRPSSILNETNVDDALPIGFRERTSERGIIVQWAPQISVLAHPSTGGFLSHCGWNSTLETLWLGVPLLTWPQRADQGVNKKFITEDWEVGLPLHPNEEGKVTRDSIHKSTKALIRGDKGVYVREKVKGIQELMMKATQDGGSSRNNLDLFISDLRALHNTRQ